MPNLDFTNVPDGGGFEPLPEGEYVCEIINVEEQTSSTGKDNWNIKFEVIDGDSKGRYLKDNMYFTEASLKRLKNFCSAVGLNVAGKLNLETKNIMNRRVKVNLKIEEYADNGDLDAENKPKTKRNNKIAYWGYNALTKEDTENLDNDIPF